ncbi:MAG TPA: DUF6538 domain-containing protein [Azospirillaceae bacterium]|nr:DUF6538 domain-containing protein [Azospirillaceae bacterium]
MRNPGNTICRGRTYHLNMRVTKDLASKVVGTRWRKSLGTKDRKRAASEARRLTELYLAEIERLRTPTPLDLSLSA